MIKEGGVWDDAGPVTNSQSGFGNYSEDPVPPLLMLLCFFGEKCYDAKLLSGFGKKGKCVGGIGQKFRVGPVHTFSTRKGLRIQSCRTQ
jgi:hypothetical protein